MAANNTSISLHIQILGICEWLEIRNIKIPSLRHQTSIFAQRK